MKLLCESHQEAQLKADRPQSSPQATDNHRLNKTESVGPTAWRPYAPTGEMRHDNDECEPVYLLKLHVHLERER